MRSHKTMLITSCKGGIGKSTVAVNLGAALAARDSTVLMMDFDFSNRCLDLFSGKENDIMYDFGDVYSERTEASAAVIKCGYDGRLMLCAAPYADSTDNYSGVKLNFNKDSEKILSTLVSVIEASKAEYVLVDCSGSDSIPPKIAAQIADTALIVTSHQPAAIRAAEQTGIQLQEAGVSQIRLIINFFDSDSVKNGFRRGIIEIIDSCRIQILGAVPYNKSLELAQEEGKNSLELKKNEAAFAFRNIAGRIMGENIPLFHGMKKFSQRKKFW